jgi:hypothetical protein
LQESNGLMFSAGTEINRRNRVGILATEMKGAWTAGQNDEVFM